MKLKNLMKFDFKNPNSYILPVALLFVLFIPKIIQNFKNKTNEEDEVNDEPSDLPPIINTNQSFDKNKNVYYGSKGKEVYEVQYRFNEIINFCRDYYYNKKSSIPSDKVSRFKQVAELTKLEKDSQFGTKTKNVCKIIMGKDYTSINAVDLKKQQFKNLV